MASILNATTSSGLVTSADNSGSLQLATNNGTTAVTIDTSQNVGIGSTSPVSLLEVKDASPVLTINQTDTSTTCRLAFYGYNRNYETTAINTTEGGTAGAGNLVFWTNPGGSGNSTERMRIDSSGNVGIGLTSVGTHRLNVSNNSVADDSLRVTNARATSGDRVAVFRLQANTNNTSSRFLTCSGNDVAGNGDAFIIYGNGNAVNVNNSYGAISDVKLKENIVDATPKLADLMQVKVRNYNLIGDTQKQIGVVAQELEEVFAGLVDETADKDIDGNELGTTTKSVKYSVFVPMLIKAIQELKAELDATKAEVQALKGVA